MSFTSPVFYIYLAAATALFYALPGQKKGGLIKRRRQSHHKKMKNRVGVILLAAFLGAFSSNADASCVCLCVGGQTQPFCSEATDLPFTCGPALCPVVQSFIGPGQPPIVWPLAIPACYPVQIPDAYGQYQWQTSCH